MISLSGTEISRPNLSSSAEMSLCNDSPNSEQKSEEATYSVSLTGVSPSNSDSHLIDIGQGQILHILENTVLNLKETLLNGLFDSPTSEEATDGTGQTRKRQRSVSPNSSQGSGKKPTKRSRKKDRVPSDEADGSNDDEEDGDDGSRKRNEKRPPLGFTPRLKCPFYQRAPEKHCRAACRGMCSANLPCNSHA